MNIKNNLKFLDLNVLNYWHYNKPKYEVEFDNFYNDELG